MLNINPAMAVAATAETADAYSNEAAPRPLAGFGTGAFVCAGASSAFRINEMAALAFPRVKSAPGVNGMTVIGSDQAPAAAAGAGYKTSVVDIVQRDSVQRDTHNFIQTARLYPVTRGGVGPHPVREPEPV